MTEKSGLAAVAAAAAGTAVASKPEPLTADRVKAEHPAVYDAIFTAGAAAEQARVIGIEQAAMPGHEAVITAMKADRSKTPADAAFAVISAEKTARASHLASLSADEQAVAGLRAAPAPAVEPTDKAEAPAHVTAAKAKAYIAEHVDA